jgi:hypothetical protein
MKAWPEMQNEDVLLLLSSRAYGVDRCAIEMIASYGMPVGASTFETCVWIGRFMQQFGAVEVDRIFRKDVKMYLCHSMRAKDANIAWAIRDRFEPTGGGKNPVVGTKAHPGPLYGVAKHAWAALGVALTWQGQQEK